MNRVKHIDIDLNAFKIALRFQNAKDPLILHFDTPSRKFYLSLIALIVQEMKQQDQPGFVYIRKHENLLKLMDDTLAGSNASGTIDGMWEKIRKAWHYSLPNLEEAANFRIENRDQIAPYEKGGKYLYECTEEECDIWASLFGVDDITNKWRFRFAPDSILLSVDDICLTFDSLKDGHAWKKFLINLEDVSVEKKLLDGISEKTVNRFSVSEKMSMFSWIVGKRWYVYATIIVTMIIVLIGSLSILNRKLRTISPSFDITQTSKPSIAVLPFINLSEDPKQEYFADGITENIITALSKIPQLFVISRTSAFTYKDKPTIVQTVSEELGVRYILEGSVQVSNDKLRVTAQLIDSSKGFHIWSDRYDRELKDIFSLQDEIAMQVITELQVKLTEGEKVRMWTKGTKNLEAQIAFIQGTFHFFELNPDDLLKAKGKFEKAISLDPNYAEAYGFLSFVHWLSLRAGQIKDSKRTENIIYEFAQKALDLDEDSVMGHLGLFGYYATQKQFDKATAHSEKAITISPNNSMAVRVHGVATMMAGYPEKAIPFFHTSMRLDPKVPGMTYSVMGAAYRHLKKYAEAIPYLEKSDNHTPKNILTLMNLAACYIGVNEIEKAKETANRVLEINPKMNVETFIKRTEHKDEEEKRIWSKQLLQAGIPLRPPK